MPPEDETIVNHITYRQYTPAKLDDLLDSSGYVYIDEFAEGFDYVNFLQRLGPVLPQYDGELVWSVKADERYDDVYHSLNTKELAPHTECYEFDGLPPKYLALWCLVPAADAGGQTTLGDLYAFLDTLTPAERNELASRKYEFLSTPGLQNMQLGRAAVHPVLEERDDMPPVMRFSSTCLVDREDPFIADIRQRLVGFVERTQVSISFTAGSLLLWDNHRMAHARTSFADRRRHLRRVWLGRR